LLFQQFHRSQLFKVFLNQFVILVAGLTQQLFDLGYGFRNIGVAPVGDGGLALIEVSLLSREVALPFREFAVQGVNGGE
jgi:hypothetical protein